MSQSEFEASPDESKTDIKPQPEDALLDDHDKSWERRTIRKIDLRLLIILGLCYAISLIDRANISVARVSGMQQSLQLQVGNRYSIVTLLFFIPYIIFELPSNILLRKVGARYWLSFTVLGFGVVMIGMAFVKKWWELAICRVLLGLLESAFFPGCIVLLSSWYTRYETASRFAIFYLTAMVISGFSNIIGYGMAQLNGRAGLLAWRWIFLLYGLITVVLAIAAFFLIVDFPEKSSFLDQDQKAWVLERIERDRGDAIPDKLTIGAIVGVLGDPKIWAFAYLFMTATTGSYAFAFFLPVILEGQGYSTKLSLLLSAPPYIFAAMYTLTLAVFSDKYRMRAPFIAASSIVCIVGLAVTAYAGQLGARYFGCFLTIAGAQSNVPAILAYSQNNIRMSSKRSVTSALVIGFGGIGGIIASTVYRELDYPRYVPGLWATMSLNIGSLVVLAAMSFHFHAQNRGAKAGEVEIEGSPGFLYTL